MFQLAPTRPLTCRPIAAFGPRWPSPSGSQAAGAEESAASRRGPAASDESERAAELAHDARNFLAAVNLCCELLAAPGVLAPRFRHYAADLRQIGRTGARLIEELAANPFGQSGGGGLASAPEWAPAVHPFPAIEDLADELLALESPLQALAGPDVRLEIECAPCAGQLGLNSEALVRILFNLVANAIEAMGERQPSLARRKFIRIAAQRGHGASFRGSEDNCPSPETVVLSVRDNGPGIAPGDLPRIFETGFSTRAKDEPDGKDERSRRALKGGARLSGRGLSIVRRLVESAGGRIRAVSACGFGTRFDIELPLVGASGARVEMLSSTGSGTLPGTVGTRLLGISTTAQESGV